MTNSFSKHRHSTPELPSDADPKTGSVQSMQGLSWEKIQSLLLPAITGIATSAITFMTFFQGAAHDQGENIKSIIGSSVSNGLEGRRTALYLVTDQAKDNKVPIGFAISVLEAVLQSSDSDDNLRSEIYDNIEKLTGGDLLKNLNQYDQVDLFCLRAALTPVQSRRRINIHEIEKFARTDALILHADSRLLKLAQLISDPQARIDALLCICGRSEFPDMIEKAIPLLVTAADRRDSSPNDSNHDIADFLQKAGNISASFAAKQNEIIETQNQIHQIIAQLRSKKVPGGNSQDFENLEQKTQQIGNIAGTIAYEANRSAVRLYLAQALVTRDANLRRKCLESFSRYTKANNLAEDAQRVLSGISNAITDSPDLKSILVEASADLWSTTGSAPVADRS
jgi:hypothetical protein